MIKAIICSGKLTPVEKLQEIIEENPNAIIICADGAYDILVQNNIHVDIWIGDGDSTELSLPDKLKKFQLEKSKDYSDTFAALEYCVEQKWSDCIICGSSKGRFDHIFGLTQDLLVKSREFNSLKLITETYMALAFTEKSVEYELNLIEGSQFSLFAQDDETIIDLKYAKYELERGTLKKGTQGLSNIAKKGAKLKIYKGSLLLFCGFV